MAGVDVAIDPKTGNPVNRTTPEHEVSRVYAKNGMVVIVGNIGGQDVERIVDRKEAIYRAQAINDMAAKATYSSDRNRLLSIAEMFVEALKLAAEQAGKPYKSVAVSMHGLKKS